MKTVRDPNLQGSALIILCYSRAIGFASSGQSMGFPRNGNQRPRSYLQNRGAPPSDGQIVASSDHHKYHHLGVPRACKSDKRWLDYTSRHHRHRHEQPHKVTIQTYWCLIKVTSVLHRKPESGLSLRTRAMVIRIRVSFSHLSIGKGQSVRLYAWLRASSARMSERPRSKR
jgi:hypothetical protein